MQPTMEEVEALRLRVQRTNMLGACRMCVKSIVDKSAFDSISDECPHLNNFCVVMEHILSHKLQARWSLFGSGDQMEFWEVITRYAHPMSIANVHDMEEIQSDLGRGRAWIRLSLVQKTLASFVHHLLTKQDSLKALYFPGAFLVSEELTELAGNLRCLDAIDFNLCLKDQHFDFGEMQEIQFAPYLRFRQSHSSMVDDSVEEHKLLSQNHEKARLKELAGDEWEEDEGGGADEEPLTVAQLRETIKIEKDQKNYFEELVSVRDSQLGRVQAELQNLTMESETQKKDMENVILELQAQASKLQSELREFQQKPPCQMNGNHADVSESVSSPVKKRAASFLASLLSD